MVYQIPRGGIADDAINTNKLSLDAVQSSDIADGAVTLDKLAVDSKKFGTYSETPANLNLTLNVSDLNQFVYLDPPATGSFYTITLPEIDVTPIGYWITLVTTQNWADVTHYALVSSQTGDSINGYVNNSVKISAIFNGVTTVTISLGVDGWVVKEYKTTGIVSDKNGSNLYDGYVTSTSSEINQKTLSELVYITSSTSKYNLSTGVSNGSMVTFLFENTLEPSNLEIASASGNALIMGESSLIVDIPLASLTLTYVNSTIGWRIF